MIKGTTLFPLESETLLECIDSQHDVINELLTRTQRDQSFWRGLSCVPRLIAITGRTVRFGSSRIVRLPVCPGDGTYLSKTLSYFVEDGINYTKKSALQVVDAWEHQARSQQKENSRIVLSRMADVEPNLSGCANNVPRLRRVQTKMFGFLIVVSLSSVWRPLVVRPRRSPASTNANLRSCRRLSEDVPRHDHEPA